MTVRPEALLALLLAAGPAAATDPTPGLRQPEAYAAPKHEPSIREAQPATPSQPLDGEKLRFAQAIETVPAPRELPPAGLAPGAALVRPIGALTLDAAAEPVLVEQMAKIPDSFAIKDIAVDRFGDWQAPASEATLEPPRFFPTAFHFAAPAVYTRPLYFEQPNVERYGHHIALCQRDNLSQSALSAAHFFATVPVLPYMMGANHPDECSYVLGSYRPGSCNPHQLLRPEFSLGGIALEGVAVTGLVFLIP